MTPVDEAGSSGRIAWASYRLDAETAVERKSIETFFSRCEAAGLRR